MVQGFFIYMKSGFTFGVQKRFTCLIGACLKSKLASLEIPSVLSADRIDLILHLAWTNSCSKATFCTA